VSSKKTRSQILSNRYISPEGRCFLSRREEKNELPPLNKIQLDSYNDFLQHGISPSKRENKGLQYLFSSTFPFKSSDGKVKLEFQDYKFEKAVYTPEEAVALDRTYNMPVKATIRLILEETGEIKEQEIYVCDIPLMTANGTFIINGAERVVVSQIHRSPGVIFDFNVRGNMYHSRLIPDRGPWLEFEAVKDILYIRIDRKARIPVSTLFRALGFESNEDIVKIFFTSEIVKLSTDKEKMSELLLDRCLFNDLKDKEGNIILRAGIRLQSSNIKKIMELGLHELALIPQLETEKNDIIINTLERDTNVLNQAEACSYIYFIIRGTEPTNKMVAKNEIIRRWKCKSCEAMYDVYDKPLKCTNCGAAASELFQADKSMFFNNDIYSLGSVGRYKINKKFNTDANQSLVLSPDDIINTIKYLIKVRLNELPLDDIDHLGNRRIRSVGEQLVNHLKMCFSRMERLAKERITIQDHNTLTPQNLISIKPITAGIKEFFGTAQLSQFMDQTNPLSATTHKRRLNALGPGGLTRERAGFEVRDIHYTHYGRMCPIETPEGPNIGLIVSLATYALINKYGFIETPYYQVQNGKVNKKKIHYLSAIEEDRYAITPASTQIKKDDFFKDKMIPCRQRDNYPMKFPKEVNYQDVSSMQIVSISSALIPFLEHDDANRALMGSNMQRQAVPLLMPESPLVGTGIEKDVALYSGFIQTARENGTVEKVDNAAIHIKNKDGKTDTYNLVKSSRTNQDTFFNQRPIVKEGDKVKPDQILTDGPSVQGGELALGKNVLTAFMTWEGYNYEDAILMSENLLKNDTFTSIHVQDFEVESRETKLGKEQITPDIPNISEEDFKDLDEDGIIHIGTKVKSGSILVGKVTPKGHTEITPEYKLLHSIFGEKARDVKDTSLRVPHGTEGIVIDVKRYTREEREDLKPGVIERVKVFVAKKRVLREGDKFAGRHGNKGVVARVLPIEDMPYLEDGTPVDLVLNPLGVPSRMNIGQVFEVLLGWVGKKIDTNFATPVFNSVAYEDIAKMMKNSGLNESGTSRLFDGRTGEPIKNEVTVGYMYYLKLHHLADDKIHARSTGPYSLVTQQPLGGKAQFGGQRVGEMEVWAIEAYGAANILQEFLTVKADAMEGRTKIYESIVKGEFVSMPGIPESFNVLVQELRGLGLNIEIEDVEGNEIEIAPKKKKDLKKRIL